MTQIRIDPFFDSDGRGGAPEGAVAVPRAPTIPATPASRNGYYDAAQVRVADGRDALAVMRPGPEGLRGTVIPRATLGGIPVGTRPHEVSNLRVTIDPHIDGQSSIVRLGDITEASVAAATAGASELTPDPYDMATQRLRGSAVLHGIAAQAGHPGATPVQPGFEGPVPPGNVRADNLGHYAQPVQPTRRLTSPLQAFGQAAPHVDPESGRAFRSIDMRPGVPQELQQPTAPTVEVTFELQHFGTHTAHYHDVITRYPGFIVLVYNNAYRGGNKYFPQVREDAPPMALNVVGKPKVYLVLTTGFQYAYGDLEFAILMVERQTDAPAEEQAAPQQ